MKNIINIFLSVTLLLGTISCTDLLDPKLKPAEAHVADDALVTVTFGVPDEIGTKALGLTPNITTMHVFVFNADGSSLVRAAKATSGAVTANYDGDDAVDGVISYWSVELPMSNAQRRLHFVANLGEKFALPTSGDEVTVMRSLIMTDGADAYWQRKILTNGIRAYTYDGSGEYTYVNPSTGLEQKVNVSAITGVKNLKVNTDKTYEYDVDEMHVKVSAGDYITIEGHKSLDGKGLYASKATSDVVSRIPMVRNFTSVRASSSWDKFTLKKVALVNTPKAGYAVPYDLKNGKFVEQYINATTKTDLVHSVIADTGYPATIPAQGIDTDEEGLVFETATESGEATAFMYERGLPTENPTCLLVGGVLDVSEAPKDDDGNTWFKIEITDAKGNYFPFFRNFTYLLDIKRIEGTNGYGSAHEAFEAGPVGDLSSSPELEHELSISDNGLTLQVEYIDYTDLDGNTDEHTKTLLYKFFYKSGSTETPLNGDNVTLTVDPYQNISPAIVGTPVKNSTNESDGWRKVTLTLAGTGETIKKSDLVVTGTVRANEVSGITKNKTLSRRVVYTVLPKTPLVVQAEPLCADAMEEETTVTINLPNNLGYSVFPLTLMIEAANNCLTSETLTVETGTSIQTNSTKNTFYFLKTVSYSEYQAATAVDVTVGEGEQAKTIKMKPFDCVFKTTKQSGNAPTTIYVKDKGGRFDLASAPLTVATSYFKISPKSQTVKASETSTTFKVRTSATGTWSLTAPENVTLKYGNITPARTITGTGNQTITATFPSNTDTENDKIYTVTAKCTGFDDQVFTITQAKKTRAYYKINLDAGGNYGYPWIASTINPDSNIYLSYQSNNKEEDSSIATMSVTVVGYTEFTVYIRSNAEDNYDYVVVRNIGSEALNSWIANSAYYESKANTRGNQRSDTTISSYTEVKFTTSDGLTDDDTPHTFYIQYGKDNSYYSGDDRGYVLIPMSYTLNE